MKINHCQLKICNTITYKMFNGSCRWFKNNCDTGNIKCSTHLMLRAYSPLRLLFMLTRMRKLPFGRRSSFDVASSRLMPPTNLKYLTKAIHYSFHIIVAFKILMLQHVKLSWINIKQRHNQHLKSFRDLIQFKILAN